MRVRAIRESIERWFQGQVDENLVSVGIELESFGRTSGSSQWKPFGFAPGQRLPGWYRDGFTLYLGG